MNLPRGDRQSAELGRVGAKLVQGHREGDHRTRCNPDVVAGNDEPARTLVERLDRTPDGMLDRGIVPAHLREKIVGACQGREPPIDRGACMGHAGRGAQTLIGDRTDGGEHILDPVMQLGVDQMLQLARCVAFFGVDAGLDEQRVGVDARCSMPLRLSFSS